MKGYRSVLPNPPELIHGACYWLDPATVGEILEWIVKLWTELIGLIEYSSLAKERKNVLTGLLLEIKNLICYGDDLIQFDRALSLAMIHRVTKDEFAERSIYGDDREKLFKEYVKAIEFYISEMNKQARKNATQKP